MSKNPIDIRDAIVRREDQAVSSEEIALIRRTVAQGATEDELRLYLYDCKRQGVHPLDKLLHFTKRGGKYTPITSIDLMRSRAADTLEYAGSDDVAFEGDPRSEGFKATATVYRIVQGVRCAFTATAWWSEYCPPSGQDRMWLKMPHGQLGKCAEALALRKGFPRQLAGLYASEEMDQAGGQSIPIEATYVEQPEQSPKASTQPAALPPAQAHTWKCKQEQRERMEKNAELCASVGMTAAEIGDLFDRIAGVRSPWMIEEGDAGRVIGALWQEYEKRKGKAN